MLLQHYLQKTSNLFAENRLLKFVVVIMCLTQVWCVFRLETIKDRIRTVIQPPVINSKVEVTGSWTSDSYVKEYIRYVSALAWNYSPATVRNQFAELLVSWDPAAFEAAKSRLYILADQIEQTRSSSMFYISNIKHDPDRRVIEVTGNRNLTMQDKSVESKSKTYVVTYRVDNGRFWLVSMEEKDQSGKKVGGVQPGMAPQEVPQIKPSEVSK
jgi:conjugal transfer pilus assembly protein TraE